MKSSRKIPHILVVDPDPLFRELLTYAFERRGYSIEAVGALDEAIDKLGLTPTDLAIVDHFMSDPDGRPVRDILQAASPLPLPVIFQCPTGSESREVTAKNFDIEPLVLYVDWLFGKYEGSTPTLPDQPGWIGFAKKRSSRFYQVLKRIFDVVAAGAAVLLLSPLFIAIAIAIKVTSQGPVFFRQERVGLDGRLFGCFKFRTMVVNAEALKKKLLEQNQHGEEGVTFKMKRDPRITAIGAWLRRFSIDELPQLFNVMGGSMTFVGPRPPVPEEVAQYTLLDRHRLSVRPGLTCLWQVGGRSEIDFIGQVNLDLEYIQKRSLKEDLVILLKTLPAVVSGKGAY